MRAEQSDKAQIVKDLGRALPRRYCDQQIGGRVKYLRTRLGFTQAQFAFPGCNISNLSQIERGIHIPNLELSLKLCLMLNCNPRYLFWGRGQQKLLPERQRYILEFLGADDRELRAILNHRRKSR